MKFRYKPHYPRREEIVEFDPGTEIICPLCGAVKPVPIAWQTHTTIVCCPGSPETHSHNVAMSDINSLLGDFDTNEQDGSLLYYRIQKGEIFMEDLREWVKSRTLWHVMYTCGSPPKWKIEPDPFWRAKRNESIRKEKEKENREKAPV